MAEPLFDQAEAVADTATIPAEPEPETSGAKRGRLTGAALTEEALDSSRSVLQPTRKTSQLKGLQQWFSPPEAAGLIAAVFEECGAPEAVLDPTAGDGALLSRLPEETRFGIEIDADHTKDAPYRAITGDAQKVAPMLRAAGLRFPALALNPPFGLSWRDPAHASGEVNSTSLCYLWALDLLDLHGQGAMICGRDRFATEVLNRPEGRGVYAVVEVEGPLFEDVALPTAIAFFVHPGNRVEDLEPARLFARREELPALAPEINEAREAGARYVSTRARVGDLEEGFRAVAKEHARRNEEQQAKKSARHDLSLRGAKVSVGLSAYAKRALVEAGTLREVELLSGQHVSYFSQNKRAFRQLREAETEGCLTIDPALSQRVEDVIASAEMVGTPLFPLRPQMRLGWLTDLEKIPCIKDDPERGFAAGEEYSLSTRSKVNTDSESRVVDNREGEPELRRFQTERRLLEVRIGSHSFDEGEENISYLTEHFDVPDPGCVATRFPDLVRDRRELLKHIARKNGFRLKLFQLDHLSRLLVKERGMLAHEPGLGKTLRDWMRTMTV